VSERLAQQPSLEPDRFLVLSVYLNGAIFTSVHRTMDAVERALRENYDSEPSDYAHLPFDEFIERLEDRDALVIGIEGHTLP